MIKLLITLSSLIYATGAYAQCEGKLYATTADYVQKKPTTATVIIEKRSGGSIAMIGGSDYKIYKEGDKALTKELKKTYFLVECNDSLYVNFKYMGSHSYGVSFYRNDEYVFFIGAESNVKNSDNAALMFGAIGGLAAAGAKYNYILNLSDRSIHFVEPEYMKKIFGETELYQRYKNEKNPYLTEVVLQYLKEHYK